MDDPHHHPPSLTYPELIVGVAGPIGVNMDLIARSLESALADVGYSSELVKLTAEMERYSITEESLIREIDRWKGGDTFNTYMRKMSQANALRKQYDDPAVLARIAVDTIRERRGRKTRSNDVVRER